MVENHYGEGMSLGCGKDVVSVWCGYDPLWLGCSEGVARMQ